MLRSYGVVGRPRLGIRAQDTEDEKGAKVLDIAEESIAEKAGIKKDDVITEFDGKPVNNADDLSAAARDSREKPSIKVKLNRGGTAQNVEIKIPKNLKTTNL
jgi:serine protease Do